MGGTDIRMTQLQSKRGFIVGVFATGTALIDTPKLAQGLASGQIRHSFSTFKLVDSRDHTESRKSRVIISDTSTRFVKSWSEDECVYKFYPSCTPPSDDLTRLGDADVIRNVEEPRCTSASAISLRNLELPAFVSLRPDNPPGTHAHCLSLESYRIHGTMRHERSGAVLRTDALVYIRAY